MIQLAIKIIAGQSHGKRLVSFLDLCRWRILLQMQSSIPPMHTYARQDISISPHDNSNMKLGKHVCPVCRMLFKKPANLKNHVSKFHADQGLAENPNSKLLACMVSTIALKISKS